MARTRNVSTPALSDVVRSIGWVLLSAIAGAAVLVAQARGDPTAQQPSKLVFEQAYYSNENCEGRPSTIKFTLNLSMATPPGSVYCNPKILEGPDAVVPCAFMGSGLSSNTTCKRAVKTDWEMPVPGYMCEINYAGGQCGEGSSDIDQLFCYTMEGFGTIQPAWSTPDGSAWSLTPVPESAGSSASTMVLAKNYLVSYRLGWSEMMFPITITNGKCVNNSRYVW